VTLEERRAVVKPNPSSVYGIPGRYPHITDVEIHVKWHLTEDLKEQL